jgi:hypothetical protein
MKIVAFFAMLLVLSVRSVFAVEPYDVEADSRFKFTNEIPCVECWEKVGGYSGDFYTFAYYRNPSVAETPFGVAVTVNGVPDTELGVILRGWNLEKIGDAGVYGASRARYAHRITDSKWFLAKTGQVIEVVSPPIYGDIAFVAVQDRIIRYGRNAILQQPEKGEPAISQETPITVRFEYFATEVSKIHFRISDEHGQFLKETVLNFEKAGVQEPRVRTKKRIK